jgi:hypothetical protein
MMVLGVIGNGTLVVTVRKSLELLKEFRDDKTWKKRIGGHSHSLTMHKTPV